MDRTCPVCKSAKLRRRELQTCGAPDCVAMWRTATSLQRAKMIDAAEELSDLLPFTTRPANEAIPNAPAPKIPTRETTVDRDNEFLKKMFGPDAPGVVETKKEDESEDK